MALQAVLLFGMGGSFRALDTAPMASQATGGIPGIHRVRDGWCTAAGHNDRARKSNGINLMDRSLLHCTGLNSAGRWHYGPRASPPRRTALSRPQPGRWPKADVLQHLERPDEAHHPVVGHYAAVSDRVANKQQKIGCGHGCSREVRPRLFGEGLEPGSHACARAPGATAAVAPQRVIRRRPRRLPARRTGALGPEAW